MKEKPKTKGILPNETLDELLVGKKTMSDLSELFLELKQALAERMLEGELSHHLGYGRNESKVDTNTRNGKSSKEVLTQQGECLSIKVPRDRESSFEPQLVKKRHRRLEGFDDKIISLYARGMGMRQIQEHLLEIYGTEVSTELISSVTDQVLEEVRLWQNRPLDKLYPVVYLDALQVKIKENGHIVNKAVYMAIGLNMEGYKEVLGLWIQKTEGAKFWLQVLTELKNRGLSDIFIACVDGLKGFPEAIEAVFPKTQVQLCIVHLVRNSLNYVSWKHRKALAKDLKKIYTAANESAAQNALEAFKNLWDRLYPTISESWARNWNNIILFLAYPDYIRTAIYTTNIIESANKSIRKTIKTKGSFPSDEAALKLIFLSLQLIQKKWTMPIKDWKLALNQFAILFADRFPNF